MALTRMIWRYGLIITLIGTAAAAHGAVMILWARGIQIPLGLSKALVYALFAITGAGACWLGATSVKEGAWAENHRPELVIDHASIPGLIAVAYAMAPDRWPGVAALIGGLALLACGLRTLRKAGA